MDQDQTRISPMRKSDDFEDVCVLRLADGESGPSSTVVSFYDAFF